MTWPYIRHVDGLISVTLDNNAWDFLHERGIDLAREFPKDRFALFITHQVEIETNAIPLAKDTLHAYIQHSMRTANIQVARTVVSTPIEF